MFQNPCIVFYRRCQLIQFQCNVDYMKAPDLSSFQWFVSWLPFNFFFLLLETLVEKLFIWYKRRVFWEKMFEKMVCYWWRKCLIRSCVFGGGENKKECWKKETGALYEQQFFSLFVPTLTNISLHHWAWRWAQMMTEGEYIDEPVRWHRGAGQRSDKGRSGVVINHCGIPNDRPTRYESLWVSDSFQEVDINPSGIQRHIAM